jgi:hypothetical protein
MHAWIHHPCKPHRASVSQAELHSAVLQLNKCFIKGDASHFKHFLSLFRGFKATHQSVAEYPVSSVRDIEQI